MAGNGPAAGPQLYVCAPGDVGLGPLLDGLRRRGVQPYLLSDVAPLGGEVLDSLRLAILGADRVLVVLGDTPAPGPVFEAGLALGLGKPLLIIAAPGTVVPPGLAGQVIVQAHPDDLDAINFALDHLRHRTARGERRTPRPAGRPLGPGITDQLLHRLSAAGCTQAAAVEVLAEAIEATGSIVVGNDGRRGFDLGVWSDDLEAIAGNPLLVKVERSLAPGAADQVLDDLAGRPSARLGLVVYLDRPSGYPPPSGSEPGPRRSPVLAISVNQLLRGMASASFAEVVRDISSQSARGLPAP